MCEQMGLVIYSSASIEQKASSQDSGAYKLQLNQLMHSPELPELTCDMLLAQGKQCT